MWNINSTDEVSIVLRDGTSWIKSAECVGCTSTNVFPSQDVLEGMKSFDDATGLKSSIMSRRLEQYNEPVSFSNNAMNVFKGADKVTNLSSNGVRMLEKTIRGPKPRICADCEVEKSLDTAT